MHLRRVLPQPRGDHVLGFLDRDTVHMVDLFTNRIFIPKMSAAGCRKVKTRKIGPLRRLEKFHADGFG